MPSQISASTSRNLAAVTSSGTTSVTVHTIFNTVFALSMPLERQKNGLSTAAKAGVGVGVGVGGIASLALLGGLLLLWRRRNTDKAEHCDDSIAETIHVGMAESEPHHSTATRQRNPENRSIPPLHRSSSTYTSPWLQHTGNASPICLPDDPWQYHEPQNSIGNEIQRDQMSVESQHVSSPPPEYTASQRRSSERWSMPRWMVEANRDASHDAGRMSRRETPESGPNPRG